MHPNVQAVNYVVGTGPVSAAIADLNKDGYPDIVTANHNAHTVSVLLGNAAGTFSPAPNSPYAVGTRPYSVAIADLNGDRHLDIVIANSGSNSVSVLFGNASGTFAPAPNSPYAVDASPRFSVIADFNQDGYLDIVTVNYNAHTVSVLFGNHVGIFAQSTRATYPVGAKPHSVAIGDFNKDGYLDIVTANDSSNSVSVLFGGSNGTFSQSANSPYSVGTRPLSVAIADLNKDGYLDIVTTNYGANSVSVLLGNAVGTFSPAPNSPYSVGRGPHSVAIADLNGDRHLDIVIANSGSNSISVLLGNEAGIFFQSTNSPYSVGIYPHAVAIADLNNDGNLDVVTANYGAAGNGNTVSILYGTIDGRFSQSMDKFIDQKLGQAMHHITHLEQKIEDLKLELEMKDQQRDNEQNDTFKQCNSSLVQLQKQLEAIEYHSIVYSSIIVGSLILGAEKGPSLLSGAALGAASGTIVCGLLHHFGIIDYVTNLIGDAKFVDL